MASQDPPRRLADLRILTFLLLALAAVVVVATLGGVGWIGYECLLAERIPASAAVFSALRLLVGGLGAAGILLGLAAVIHYVRRLTLTLEPAKGDNPSAPPGGGDPRDMASSIIGFAPVD